MKSLLFSLSLIVLAGCSSPANPASTAADGSGKGTLAQKLQSMPAAQRADYVKNHLDEVKASAGIPNTPH